MIEKIKLFIKKYGIMGITLVVIVLGIVALSIFSLLSFGRFDLKKITEKLDKVIDKSKDKLHDIEIKKVELDITKKVELEKAKETRDELVKKHEEIKTIPDKKKRIDELIKFNKSIEVKL